jgi:MoaA/NifB/PqqE/SkfB family radical SAM enzyme
MCDYWKRKFPQDLDEELKVEDYEVAAKKVAEIGASFVSISGGEPFIKKDLLKIISVLSKRFGISLITNGTLITRQKIRLLSATGIDAVFISLDYADPKKHDYQRGKEGTFKRAIKSLKILKEEMPATTLVGITCVLNSTNLNQIDPLLELCDDLNIKFNVSLYSPIKTGNNSLKIRDLNAVYKLLNGWKKNLITNKYYLELFCKYFPNGIPNCKSGKHFFNIDSWGNISRCVECMNNPIGNILNLPSKEISSRLNNLPETSCTECWYTCRGNPEIVYTPKGVAYYLITAMSNINIFK